MPSRNSLRRVVGAAGKHAYTSATARDEIVHGIKKDLNWVMP